MNIYLYVSSWSKHQHLPEAWRHSRFILLKHETGCENILFCMKHYQFVRNYPSTRWTSNIIRAQRTKISMEFFYMNVWKMTHFWKKNIEMRTTMCWVLFIIAFVKIFFDLKSRSMKHEVNWNCVLFTVVIRCRLSTPTKMEKLEIFFVIPK